MTQEKETYDSIEEYVEEITDIIHRAKWNLEETISDKRRLNPIQYAHFTKTFQDILNDLERQLKGDLAKYPENSSEIQQILSDEFPVLE